MPKKPTGEIGPFSVANTEAGISGQWNKVQFPDSKESIEHLIMKMFVRAVKTQFKSDVEYEPNPESDLDFTVRSNGETASLELTEAIYRDGAGRPYDSDDILIHSYIYAEQIYDAIKKKSDHYGPQSGIPIDLLVYITHWRFTPDRAVIGLVQYFLQKTPPVFGNVFFLIPSDEHEGHLWVLFPIGSHDSLGGQGPEAFRNNTCLTLSPKKWELKSESG